MTLAPRASVESAIKTSFRNNELYLFRGSAKADTFQGNGVIAPLLSQPVPCAGAFHRRSEVRARSGAPPSRRCSPPLSANSTPLVSLAVCPCYRPATIALFSCHRANAAAGNNTYKLFCRFTSV
ncbi:hypothetical protein ACJJTC_009870 [Scirpophaga incertulas]